jgi:hypothetical protein
MKHGNTNGIISSKPFARIYPTTNVESLLNQSRKKPNLKNRIDPDLEERIVKIAVENPALGQQRVSNLLRKEGLCISAAGVRCVWIRHNLQTFTLRLKALEKSVAQDGIILTESQLAALQRKKEKDECLSHNINRRIVPSQPP